MEEIWSGKIPIVVTMDPFEVTAPSPPRPFYAMLPRVRITDLLVEVAAWSGFADRFVHARSGGAWVGVVRWSDGHARPKTRCGEMIGDGCLHLPRARSDPAGRGEGGEVK